MSSSRLVEFSSDYQLVLRLSTSKESTWYGALLELSQIPKFLTGYNIPEEDASPVLACWRQSAIRLMEAIQQIRWLEVEDDEELDDILYPFVNIAVGVLDPVLGYDKYPTGQEPE